MGFSMEMQRDVPAKIRAASGRQHASSAPATPHLLADIAARPLRPMVLIESTFGRLSQPMTGGSHVTM